MSEIIFSVSQISEYLSRKLRNDTLLKNIKITGEIANYRTSGTGTVFFSLKDNDGLINCMLFEQTDITLDEGVLVVAQGSIGFYPQNGRVNFYVTDIEVAGKGSIYEQFEFLKQKLSDEGLFDARYKKCIPKFPKTIGVITSPTGAALQDIITTANRRFSGVEIIIYPATVQGFNAPNDLICAIEYFNDNHNDINADVIIIGRGGGSFEDLNAFNNETLARAIFNSKIPVVSAVGHEIDFSIADFVADLRAPTPTAAAELCIPQKEALLEMLKNLSSALNANLNHKLFSINEELNSLSSALQALSPKSKLELVLEKLKNLSKNLSGEFVSMLERKKNMLKYASSSLDVLSPYNTLKRGYAIIKQHNSVISSKEQLENDIFEVVFNDGSVYAQTVKNEKEE